LRSRRKDERFIRRLETEFVADNKNYRGISSDLSLNGLFIRTQHAFAPDTLVDIVIHLPDAANVRLKGMVRRSIKTPIISIKNGMGIEIIENDPQYIAFIKTVYPDAGTAETAEGPHLKTSFHEHVDEPLRPAPPPPEFTIIACPGCGIKNKINNAKLSLGPKCGKCGSLLTPQA
jgi:hypothetical protein